MYDTHRILEYERWAQRRVLDRLRELPDVPKARRLFAHIEAGIRVWTMRLGGKDSTSEPIWPERTLDECEACHEDNASALCELESRISPEFLSGDISYTNQHDLSYSTRVSDVLTHLALHGAYHRGQISLVLREAGHDPVNADYITYVREQAGQAWKP